MCHQMLLRISWQSSSCVCTQPSVSVGNVGQMTTDLLISTLGLSAVGYLYTDCVVPVVGSNPYAQYGSQNMFQLTTSLEGEDIPQNIN